MNESIALNKTDLIPGLTQRFEREMNETDREKYPSNTLTDYYEVIRKLMEALTSIEGLKIRGEAAHHDIINYICDR